MRVLITGGGTAGHIYPGIAVAKALLDEDKKCKILYVGTEKGLESEIVPREGLPFQTISASGLTRRISPRIVLEIFKAGQGCVQAAKIIRRFKPDIVLGTGGYVCGPLVLVASLWRIPTVLHEQNAYPGITNRLLAPFVDSIAITYPESKVHFPKPEKCVLTGNPVRTEVLTTDKKQGKQNLSIDLSKKVILIFGGSRGASKINNAVVEGISYLREIHNLHLIFITGQQNFSHIQATLTGLPVWNTISKQVTLRPYLYNMHDALAAADLVVCRAGATTLAEITAKGIPSILIPYPYATGNHQYKNAASLEKNGAALLIPDNKLTGEFLWGKIIEIMEHDDKRKRMAEAAASFGKPYAVNELAQLIISLAKDKKKG